MQIQQITNYFPEIDDKMEGGCRGGGTKPKNPCLFLFETAIAGKADCVVAATQRTGGSAPLYGCKTEVAQVSKVAGRPVKVCFSDVYADSESEGKITRGKRMPSKFDLAVKIGSELGPKVAAAGGGEVKCNGKVDGTENGTREIARKEEATKPEPPPGGGGGAPPGGGAPSGSEPENKEANGAARPTPASPRSAASVAPEAIKIGQEKVAISLPEKKSPKNSSEITEGAKGYTPAPVDPKEGTTVAAFLERSLAKPATANGFGSSGASSPGGSSDSSPEPSGQSGGEAAPASDGGQSMSSGGGSSGGWSGGTSDSSKSPSSEEPDLTEDKGGEESLAEGANEETIESEGEDLGNEPSLFDRVHESYQRHRQKGRI